MRGAPAAEPAQGAVTASFPLALLDVVEVLCRIGDRGVIAVVLRIGQRQFCREPVAQLRVGGEVLLDRLLRLLRVGQPAHILEVVRLVLGRRDGDDLVLVLVQDFALGLVGQLCLQLFEG